MVSGDTRAGQGWARYGPCDSALAAARHSAPDVGQAARARRRARLRDFVRLWREAIRAAPSFPAALGTLDDAVAAGAGGRRGATDVVLAAFAQARSPADVEAVAHRARGRGMGRAAAGRVVEALVQASLRVGDVHGAERALHWFANAGFVYQIWCLGPG